jgi:hypothetical protein
MTSIRVRNPFLLASFLAVATVLAACGSSSAQDGASTLSTALEASTAASGTLLCAPADAQIAACTAKAAGDACQLVPPSGAPAVAGTCRTTIDGASVACAPPFGNSRDGLCVTARDGATLVCGRVHVPPQGAVDACATLAAGAACTMPGHGGMGAASGICSLGPASTGPLACAPQKDLLPHGEAACAGLTAGATCTLGRRHEAVAGTCVAPVQGSAAVCIVACADLRGRFTCGPGGHGR